MSVADRFQLLRSNGTIEVVERHAMLVATKTTTVKDEYGQPERLIAGKTFVRAPHFLTQTYSELFAPADKRRAKARRRAAEPRRAITGNSATPAKAPAMWKPLVRLDTRTAPTFTARLSEQAYQSMGDQAYAQRGNVETGGALFGVPARDSEDTVSVVRAGEPGPKARTSASSMHVDVEHTRREAVELHRSDTPVGWIGSWHTHPVSPDSNGQPSDSDLRFFAWDCRELHRMGRSMNHYVGLILTPTWDHFDHERIVSWARPTLHAWHMQAVAEDQFICTRATVAR